MGRRSLPGPTWGSNESDATLVLQYLIRHDPNFRGRVNHRHGNSASSKISGVTTAHIKNWRIHNSRLLGSLVRDAISERFGTQREAARQTGINQTLLSRLANETHDEIDVGNFIKLHSLIPEGHHGDLDLAIVPRGARLLGRRYSVWLGRSLQIASTGVGDRLIRTADGYKTRHYRSDEGEETWRDYERSALWRYVRRRSPHLHREAEKVFRRHADPRLPLTRILDPLINSPESGFIERSWRELRAANYTILEQIIELGIRREHLMLAPQSTLERMIEVFTMSSDDFLRRFGKEALVPSLLQSVRKNRGRRMDVH